MIALLCAYNSVNYHAIICLPIMYIFGRDTSSELWTRSYFPILLRTVFITFHHYLLAGHISSSLYFTSTHLILYVWQARGIDNLFVLLRQSNLFVIVCRSTTIIINGTIDTLLKPSASPTESDNLGFVIKGKLLMYCIIPSSWDSPANATSSCVCIQKLINISGDDMDN